MLELVRQFSRICQATFGLVLIAFWVGISTPTWQPH